MTDRKIIYYHTITMSRDTPEIRIRLKSHRKPKGMQIIYMLVAPIYPT